MNPTIHFEEYQHLATRTMKRFADPTVGRLYFPLKLNGEAGEVAELVGKSVRDEVTLDKAKLAEEIGDVLWYLAAICQEEGLSLASIAVQNVQKLQRRYPGGAFNARDSIDRKE